MQNRVAISGFGQNALDFDTVHMYIPLILGLIDRNTPFPEGHQGG